MARGAAGPRPAGLLDIPWSPNRFLKAAVTAARDGDGDMRILDAACLPLPKDVLQIHEERLRQRAERDGIAYGPDLAVAGVVEVSEPLDRLCPFPWAGARGAGGRPTGG